MHALTDSAKTTILHLGLGAFHRAHQADYLQDLHNLGDTRWQIKAGNIRPGDESIISELQVQSGAYTLETVSPTGERCYRNIDSITEVVKYTPGHSKLAEIAADQATKIISFTVTEAGYYLDANDQLDRQLAALAADIENSECNTIYGVLVRLLKARRQAEAGPVTLLSCDNLQGNGHRFANAFYEFLTLRGETELLEWVRQNTCCPSSMVDRITPRPDAAVSRRIAAVKGALAHAGVCAESYRQWVIEDKFCAGRPDWQEVGAELIDDVAPYERAKLQILNASHSAVAWLGLLRGHRSVHESATDPVVLGFATDFVNHDVIPSLGAHPMDLEQYRDDVFNRFANAYIIDDNERILSDSLAKISAFILPTLRSRLDCDASISSTSRVLAAYLRLLQAIERRDLAITYRDQLLTKELRQQWLGSADVCTAFCNTSLIFKDLAGDKDLVSAVRKAYQSWHD